MKNIKINTIKILNVPPCSAEMIYRHFRTFSQLKNDYAIMAVSLLQRNPIVMRPLSQIELEYSKYRQNLEIEKARGTFNIAADSGKITSGSIPVGEIELLNKLALNDLNDDGNAKDLGRKLDRKLYLCLKDEMSGKWSLPMTRFDQPDSALHLEAQKSLSDLLSRSQNLELYHLGAAPVAFYLEKFTDRSAAPFGCKHFFFRSQLVAGRVRIDAKRYPEYGWFSREEMAEKLPRDMFESIEAVVSE